jgi:hypothetical protein
MMRAGILCRMIDASGIVDNPVDYLASPVLLTGRVSVRDGVCCQPVDGLDLDDDVTRGTRLPARVLG